MKALLKNYRQSPRKVRLVARLIQGKTVGRALLELANLDKRASSPIEKLIRSAVSNAKKDGVEEKDLIISKCVVDKGLVMKRSMPRARGSASPIKKKLSHVSIELSKK